MKDSLWKRSSIWRWAVVFTVFATVAAILASPWATSSSGPITAKYTPAPAASQGPNLVLPSSYAGAQKPYARSTVSKNTPQFPSSTQPTRDTTFDIDIPRPAIFLPPETELHMIGVYKGAVPDGVKEKPWWANCTDSNGQVSDQVECHRKYAGRRVPREVKVYIRYQVPVVLALMSYEPVIWNIQGAVSSQIQKVILAGYYGQDIKGIPDNIPVDVYTHEASSCSNCSKQPGYFYSYKNTGREYDNAVDRLKSITGLDPVSFQGSHQANAFSLRPSIAASAGNKYHSAANEEPVTGKIYRDHLIMANTKIPLPAGPWKTIIYARVPNGNEENALISLAQIKEDVLQSLFAVRVKIASDTKTNGKKNLSCHNANNFFEAAEINRDAQRCYWIEQLNNPWQQPLFDLTAARLKTMNVAVPANIINIGFHKANPNAVITAYKYANPEAEGIYTQPSSWSASPWNNSRIHQDPDREAFLNEQKHWADIWFQFFRLN